MRGGAWAWTRSSLELPLHPSPMTVPSPAFTARSPEQRREQSSAKPRSHPILRHTAAPGTARTGGGFMHGHPFSKGLHDLGDGCYAWLQPDGSWGLSNAGLIVDGSETLLVDTLFDLQRTREM